VSCAPERSGFPSRAGAAGSNHLPWALLRILQAIPKIKRARRGSGRPAVRGRGGVCSKDASDAFGPGKHGSAIAAADAERPRGDWSRWKAQERYRATPAAREKRNGQSGRYRERVKDRKTQQKEVVQEAARVITAEDLMATATGRDATRASCAGGEARCNGSARTRVGVRWSASGNGNGDGMKPARAEQMPRS